MAFTEFYCRSGGSNMNGGGLSTGAEPSTAAAYSATNGGWSSTTGVFTPTSGNPSLSVTVGDFANVFTDGSTTPVFIGRVTAVNSTTVTVSTTAKSGTAPTTAGTGISINVGGAWKGPNGAVGFPYGFITNALTDSSTNRPRVNFKNDQTYSITAAMTHANNGPAKFQGYTTSAGDGGKATVDGGTIRRELRALVHVECRTKPARRFDLSKQRRDWKRNSCCDDDRRRGAGYGAPVRLCTFARERL
jgi:hypothetical protein